MLTPDDKKLIKYAVMGLAVMFFVVVVIGFSIAVADLIFTSLTGKQMP